MNKIYRYLLATVAYVSLIGTAKAQSPAHTAAPVTVTSSVTDASGKPVSGALVYGNEGSVLTKTDAYGRFTLTLPAPGDLLVEAPGFESAVFRADDYQHQTGLVLTRTPFLYGKNDDVRIAFGKVSKGALTNAVSMLDPGELRKYDNTQTVSSALNGLLPGMLGSSNLRGTGTPMFVVDGLPRDPATLNLAEVAQITLLKDVNASILYGNEAVNGVVLITTKRGQPFKRQVNVSAYYGMSKPSALPEYLPSADYMELYNEARRNDGLGPQYEPALIEKYRTGNPYRYPSTDYYSSEYLKKIKPFSRVMMDFSGGNNVATYYSNIGWSQSGSLLNFGEGKSGKTHTLNIRGNIDLKVNPWIKSALDAVVVLNNSSGAQGNYWGNAATLRPNLFAPLIPIALIDPENRVLKGRKNDIDGMYLLGGTTAYQTNPIASGYSGGNIQQIQRNFSFNNRIDFDLGQAVEGLAFHTNLSFDFLTLYDQFISNQYAVYEPVWADGEDRITDLKQYGENIRPGTQNVGNSSYRRRIGFYGLLDYNRTFSEVHRFTGSLLGFLTSNKLQGDLQGSKNANLGLRLTYGYRSKYLLDFSSAFVNSVKLPADNRTAFSPSLGLAWVLSSEDFLSSVSFLDYLKLRVSAGRMNSDAGIDGFYYYDDRYGGSGSYSWYEGTRSRAGIVPINSGNNALAFEKRSEINAGFQGILFNNRLTVDANIFASVYADQITRPQTIYPSYFTNYIPYQNFDKNGYRGAELGITVRQDFGKVAVTLGANGLYATSKVLKRDEIYADQHRFRTGQPVDARFGLVAEGFFADAADIENHAVQAFGAVKPGDVKYADRNGDGVVDANDEQRIGRSQAPFSYGLNLKVAYKNFTLFARGNGRNGADGMLSNDYFWVDGNDKYSAFIRDRWTEATKHTATLPRLSSLASSNNYRSSTLWRYRDNYFTLDRVQLTYDVPLDLTNKLHIKALSFFTDASNLLTVSRYRRYRELNIGAEPQYRSFSLGLNAWF